ncbi:unnamed protein product [Camellia sinensis]
MEQKRGVRQMRIGWADGPEFVTQCPIRPGKSYTYLFTIQGQEGTLVACPMLVAESHSLRCSDYSPKRRFFLPIPQAQT